MCVAVAGGEWGNAMTNRRQNEMRNMLTFRRASERSGKGVGGEGQHERVRGKQSNVRSREAAAVEIRKAFVEIKKPETGDPDNIMTAKRD